MKYICKNRFCGNYNKETKIESRYDGSEKLEAFGCPCSRPEYTTVTECCGSEDLEEQEEDEDE
jgi:hypothetical protein